MRSITRLLQGIVPFTGYPYAGRDEGCNLCGSRDKTVVCSFDRRIKKLTTVICDNCGLLRTDPMPTAEELAEYYASEYRFDYQFAGSRPPRFHVNRSMRRARARYERLAPLLRVGARVLDFGSGAGEFLAVCKEHGGRVLGLEPGTDYARFAMRTYGVEVQTKGWEVADFEPASFDLINVFHVLEHLRQPADAVRRLASWLAPGGAVAIAVPNMSPASKRNRKLFERLHFAHVHGFTPSTLELLGEVGGLELDPRIAPSGTNIVFRKAQHATTPQFDPDGVRRLVHEYDSGDPIRHVLSFKWVADSYKRIRRDIRDTTAKTP